VRIQCSTPVYFSPRLAGDSWGFPFSVSRGFIMLEVMAAVALLGLVLGVLTTSLSGLLAGSRELREDLAEAATSLALDSEGDAWSWGPQVIDGRWGPGPVLYLQTGPWEKAQPAGDVILGLWVDGWAIGEHVLDTARGNVVRVDAPSWQGRAGGELVVRVRAGQGVWGPPWRTVVPNVEGGAVAIDPVRAGETPAGVAVHGVGLGTLAPQLAVGGMPVSPMSLGAPTVFTHGTSGLWESRLEGRVQSWWGEEGRQIDVYH